MKKVYKIAWGQSPEELEGVVNLLLSQGFEISGSMSVFVDAHGIAYCQPMIKGTK